MKRHTSRNSHRDEKPKPSRNEDSDAVLRARTEEEKRRRRREWMIDQEKTDRHNRLKRKLAMEYEIRRARNMGLPLPEGRCDRPRRSRSESPPSRHRRTSEHYTPKVTVLSKKFETSSGTTPLFKGPEGTEISPTELRKIKVDIHRNIPGRAATHELKRDVPNKEEVVLKRRAGEGSKPIFDREEIKRAISETEEVEERRTVGTVNLENSENKPGPSRRRSVSLSPTRTRRHSPRSMSSRHSRYDDSEYEHKGSYRSDRRKDHSKERKDGDRSYRDHRERTRGSSRDRRKTDRSRDRDMHREQRVPPERYIEPIPVPIYYGNFQPRPLMVGPWVPIRGPLGGNIHPPMMRPLRTFPPRSIGIPPDMYGFRPPLNPRMKRHTSSTSHRDEKPKPSRNEDSDAVLRARTEEEKRRRRREWMIEQGKTDRHNRLKRKMTLEYEIRRARNMGLLLPDGRCDRPRRSRSESPPSRHRRISEHYTPKVTVLSKKSEISSGTTPLFKGREGTTISPTELRKIKVDIHRNIPGRAATNELKRDIPNKEDVVLKRRTGEGSKPIFDREEIKRAISETEEVEGRRTVITVNLENSENKSKTFKRRSVSLSLTSTRNHSPRRTSSHHPRYDNSKHNDKGSYGSDREKDHSRERKDGDRSYRDRRKTDRSRERDMPREQMVPPHTYIEQIPVSVYYGNFQLKPLMVGPWVPIRGTLGGNIHPAMMKPFRTFPARSIGIPPDMYGFRPPLNPRFPQMF